MSETPKPSHEADEKHVREAADVVGAALDHAETAEERTALVDSLREGLEDSGLDVIDTRTPEEIAAEEQRLIRQAENDARVGAHYGLNRAQITSGEIPRHVVQGILSRRRSTLTKTD